MSKLFLSILFLLLLLAGCIIAGVIRKAFGGTFLPPPGSDGDHHVRDRSGKWWRFNAKDGWKEVFRKPADSDVVLVDRNGIADKVKQDGSREDAFWQNLSKKNH
jgi:hypothetical protein